MIKFDTHQYCVQLEDALSNEDIEKIHAIALKQNLEKGKIRDGVVDGSVRDNDITWINHSDDNSWLFLKIKDVVSYFNNNFYHFDVSGVEALQYTIYNSPGGKYGMHRDFDPNPWIQRKISITFQLSDENDYTGGDLTLYPTNSTGYKMPRKKGSATAFFSHMIHEVTPVTEGVRKSLVVWVLGPPLK